MLSALSAEGVEFLLVGAQALAVHGHVRATGDMDLWVRPTPAECSRRCVASAHRVDVLTSIDGLSFDQAWAGRVGKDVMGTRVSAIGRADLIRNKRATGRSQDLADAEALERGTEPSG